MCWNGMDSVIARAAILNLAGPHCMMAVLSSGSGSQSNHELGLHLAHDLFEREGGKMVAFADDNVAVLATKSLTSFSRCRL